MNDHNGKVMKVGYVLKRYPRYSETFIVNEILAHEAAGLEIEIFSLYPLCDTHFQDCISRVRAPVRYLIADSKINDFWTKFQSAAKQMPNIWTDLKSAKGVEARELAQALMLAMAVKDGHIDHLHAHFATTAATVTRLASRFAGVPFTMTAHAKDIFHDDVDPKDLRAKLTDAAATFTVSDFNLNYLREAYGDAASRVRRIYNGMDISERHFAAPIERAPLVVGIGRLVEKKGFDDLIRACDLLKKTGFKFQCQIVGTGEDQPTLRKLIDELDIHDRVELAGPRPQREVFELLQRASVFAAPCVVGNDGNRDGLPTVLLEAMSLGTPCVSTDVTGIPEVVQHDGTGLIVGQRNIAELAAAIRRLIEDSALRQRLALNARRLIEAEFDITKTTARQRGLFRSARDTEADPIAVEALEVA